MLPVIFITGHRYYVKFVPSYAKVSLKPVSPDVLLHAVEASLPMVRDRIVPPSAGATSLIQDAETVGV